MVDYHHTKQRPHRRVCVSHVYHVRLSPRPNINSYDDKHGHFACNSSHTHPISVYMYVDIDYTGVSMFGRPTHTDSTPPSRLYSLSACISYVLIALIKSISQIIMSAHCTTIWGWVHL